MRKIKLLLSVQLLIGTLGVSALASAAEGVISKVAVQGANYCHLKFPAIREETLYWNRPVLKDARNGDIIDFYGPCDYDPLGKGEIEAQRAYYQRERIDQANNE
ncbi:MAG: hypothetical protein ACREQA_05635 [Candidatus Binatia bacterium]